MPSIDVNADLGESDDITDLERRVLGSITSTSISCGAHAGSPAGIEATVRAAASHGVVIGAHPSFPDRQGAGRRPMQMTPGELTGSLVAQIGSLCELAQAAGASVRFVKPHGALYNQLADDAGLGATVVDAVRAAGVPMLLLPAGAVTIGVAERRGVPCVTEGFADRAYRPDGRLAARGEPGAVLSDEGAVVSQALSIALDGRVRTVDGTWLAVSVASLCIHGDTPRADVLAQRVRSALEAAGVRVAPFAS